MTDTDWYVVIELDNSRNDRYDIVKLEGDYTSKSKYAPRHSKSKHFCVRSVDFDRPDTKHAQSVFNLKGGPLFVDVDQETGLPVTIEPKGLTVGPPRRGYEEAGKAYLDCVHERMEKVEDEQEFFEKAIEKCRGDLVLLIHSTMAVGNLVFSKDYSG